MLRMRSEGALASLGVPQPLAFFDLPAHGGGGGAHGGGGGAHGSGACSGADWSANGSCGGCGGAPSS
eukprot:7386591-Prymnesium_polylepis.1